MDNSVNGEKPGFFRAILNFFVSVDNVISAIGSCIFNIRKLLMTIPVVIGLAYLTKRNAELLPNPVGINLQTDGTYAVLISKNLALIGPVALTGFCLLMMYASRKTLQPWIISLFSLVLPLLIWVTNVFPA